MILSHILFSSLSNVDCLKLRWERPFFAILNCVAVICVNYTYFLALQRMLLIVFTSLREAHCILNTFAKIR